MCAVTTVGTHAFLPQVQVCHCITPPPPHPQHTHTHTCTSSSFMGQGRMYEDANRWGYLFQSYVLLTMMELHHTEVVSALYWLCYNASLDTYIYQLYVHHDPY